MYGPLDAAMNADAFISGVCRWLRRIGVLGWSVCRILGRLEVQLEVLVQRDGNGLLGQEAGYVRIWNAWRHLRTCGAERLGVWARGSAGLCDDDALAVATEEVTRLGACVFDLKFSSVSNNMHLVLSLTKVVIPVKNFYVR